MLTLALHAPAAQAEAPVVAVAAAPAVSSYQGPTTDLRGELAAAIQAGLDDQLARFYQWAASQPVPKTSVSVSRTGGSHRGYATASECVSMVEHGGSYDRSSNPTHFGRYQFSRPTWAAFGGDPATWGTASPAEQDAVFETAWNSPGGPGNWLPYDGC